MLLLAELPNLLSEMWILFNRVIQDLRCGALVRRLVEFDFVDLFYQANWWIMVLALSLSILLELVWQLIIVFTTRYEVVLLDLLFVHHRYWFALVWWKLVSLLAVVSSNAAGAAGWQAWVTSLRQNLLGHPLSADDWWRLTTSVTAACWMDVEGAWPAEAYLILDIVHKMGSLLLLLLL